MAFNQEIADKVCEELSKGRSLLSIGCDEGMPAESTLRLWEDTNPEHAANSTRARMRGTHVLAEQCIQIADTPLIGEETTEKPNGDVEIKRGDMLGHRRLQIETRMRLIGKWNKAIYGDKVQAEVSGSLGVTIQATPTDETL